MEMLSLRHILNQMGWLHFTESFDASVLQVSNESLAYDQSYSGFHGNVF